MTLLSRRRFLALAAGASAATALGALLPRGVHAAARAMANAANLAPRGVLVRNDYPEHYESTIAALDADVLTPNESFFVRSHLPVPDVDPASWSLELAGRLVQPRRWTLAELQQRGAVDRVVTLECAGNGRALFALPSTSGTQWEYGAVGNARWTGVPLGDLLRDAIPQPDAAHVWFECADAAPAPTAPTFTRSIPLAKALDDVLLAWGMNGRPLSRLHGAPLRAIVPGWFGMASAKWVTRIRVEPVPSDNHFMVKGYRYNVPGEDPAKAAAVEALRVKSLITRPLTGAKLRAGVLSVAGFAWGAAPIERVDLTLDGGRTWITAALTGKETSGAWRRFEAAVPLPAGDFTLAARATDATGAMQPQRAIANAGGYGNNSWHEVAIHAR